MPPDNAVTQGILGLQLPVCTPKICAAPIWPLNQTK
jgi:hypothetical protein